MVAAPLWPRQRTLQATVDWSYDLLDRHEQQVLCLLSVFSGGFDLAAAEALCSPAVASVFDVADAVGSLVNKSLVVADRSSGALRYRLLETVRQYGTDHLVRDGRNGALARARSDHAEHYLKLAEEAAPKLSGAQQGVWLKRLDADSDNVHDALAYLSSVPGRNEDVLRLGAALWRFFFSRSYTEPIAHLRAALERADEVPDRLRARALRAAATLVGGLLGPSRSDAIAAAELASQAVEIARRIDDPPLLAETLACACTQTVFADNPTGAVIFGEESLGIAHDLGNPRLVGHALGVLALTRASSGSKAGRELQVEALAEFRKAGDLLYLCIGLGNLASFSWVAGNYQITAPLDRGGDRAREEIGFRGNLPGLWAWLAEVMLLGGEPTKAAPLCRRALVESRRYNPITVVGAVRTLAKCAVAMGDPRRAAQLTGAADVVDADLLAERAAASLRVAPLGAAVVGGPQAAAA